MNYNTYLKIYIVLLVFAIVGLVISAIYFTTENNNAEIPTYEINNSYEENDEPSIIAFGHGEGSETNRNTTYTYCTNTTCYVRMESWDYPYSNYTYNYSYTPHTNYSYVVAGGGGGGIAGKYYGNFTDIQYGGAGGSGYYGSS